MCSKMCVSFLGQSELLETLPTEIGCSKLCSDLHME